jgi:cation diffusion facilitator family transporter
MAHTHGPADLPAGGNVRAVQRILLITLVLNLGVAALKLVYGWATDALAIRADGLHSFTDALNNVVALVAIWFASRPPDEDHPYGHRKIEFLAAGAIGLTLLAVAWDVLSDALGRLGGQGALPSIDTTAYAVLGGTWVVNLAVAIYEHRMGRKLNSPLLLSDALHTRSDVLVTAGVFGSVVLTRNGIPEADLGAALIVAGFVAWAGISVLRENLRYLTDEAPVDANRVREIANTIEGVLSTHAVRSRGGPGAVFIDLHIHVAPDITVVHAHDISHGVIDALKRELDGVADVTVHAEPEGHT